MHRWSLALLVLLAPLCAAFAAAPIDRDLELFLELFEGEFNNDYQVHLERSNASGSEAADCHPWHHHTVRRVAAPQLGEHVYYSQINAKGPTGDVVRQRLHVLEADAERGVIRQRFFAFSDGEPWIDVHRNPSRLQALDPDTLRAYPAGCEILWRREIGQFRGEIPHGACQVVSPRSGNQLTIVAEMLLASTEMWHREAGYTEDGQLLFDVAGGAPFQLRRARPFSCLVAASAGETGTWKQLERLVLHDQGGLAALAIRHGERDAFTLRLRTRPPETGNGPDMLELAVVGPADGDSVASTWTSAEATRIGLQLDWLRVSCRQAPAFEPIDG
jgi:hypothetical protein